PLLTAAVALVAAATLARPAAAVAPLAPFASAGRGRLAVLARARLRLLGLRAGAAAAVQPAEHPLPEARLAPLHRRGCGRRRSRLRRRRGRQDVRDRGLLGLYGALDFLVGERRILLRLDHLVARRGVLGQMRLVVAHAPDRVVRR